MLIPAILKKNEIQEAFKRYYYSDDTPIGIYIGASERGDVAFGVVADTKSEYNDDFYVANLTETTGEHCYCKNIYNLFDEVNSDKVVMITDGYHSEEV